MTDEPNNQSQADVNDSEPTPDSSDAAHAPAPSAQAVEPMTGGLLARLFGVPLLIVGMIVGCAVVVVLLFGSVATSREESIDSLLVKLETTAGETTAGVLLPRDKELWQTANELAQRLKNSEKELSAEERDEVITRLLAIHARDAANVEQLSDMGRKRLAFFMFALARTQSPRAVPTLVADLKAPRADLRVEALRALAEMGETARANGALLPIISALEDVSPVARSVACVALSAISQAEDITVVEALARAYVDENREVQWNAALALARMESDRGKSLLLDMLDRGFWENEVMVRTVSAKGEPLEYPMPAQAVDRYLVVSIDAAAHLQNDEIWDQIRKLASDASPAVKNAALEAAERSASAARES